MEPLRSDSSGSSNVLGDWSDKIELFSMRSLMYYHMTFHHSSLIHINHIIFLHIYLFGLFLVFITIHELFAFIMILLYCLLFIMIFRFNIISLLYSIIIIGIGLLTHYIYQQYLSPPHFDVNYKNGIPYIIGISTIIFALLSQQFAHCCCEKFTPPTSLYHGFIAAPFLEFMTLFILLDCNRLYPSKLNGIKQAIQKRRRRLLETNAFNICYHCCKPQLVEEL